MKTILTFTLFITSFGNSFGQGSENDTIYYNHSDTAIQGLCCIEYIQTLNPKPLYYTKDSSLFNGVLISKKLNIPKVYEQFNTNYSLIVQDYKNGIRNDGCLYTYYQSGLSEIDSNHIKHRSIFIPSFYIAQKRYTDKDTAQIRVRFDRNGDTLYYNYYKSRLNQDSNYFYRNDVIYEKYISKTFYDSYYTKNNIRNKLAGYTFTEKYLKYLPNGKQMMSSHDYSYHLMENGDTSDYYTHLNGHKNGYSISNLWLNDTIYIPIRVTYKNDSLENIISNNFIFVNKKLKLWTEQQFIDNNNDKYGTTHFGHIPYVVLINDTKYYIIFPKDLNCNSCEEIKQKSIDKIIKKFKKQLAKSQSLPSKP